MYGAPIGANKETWGEISENLGKCLWVFHHIILYIYSLNFPRKQKKIYIKIIYIRKKL